MNVIIRFVGRSANMLLVCLIILSVCAGLSADEPSTTPTPGTAVTPSEATAPSEAIAPRPAIGLDGEEVDTPTVNEESTQTSESRYYDDSDSMWSLSFKFTLGGSWNWFSDYNPSLSVTDANGVMIDSKEMDKGGVDRMNVGISFEIGMPQMHIYFEPGYRFVTKGTKNEGTFYGITFEDELNLSYHEVFGKLKYDIPFGSVMSLQPFAGYAVGFLHEANEVAVATGVYPPYVEPHTTGSTFDVKDRVNDMNHSVIFGADFLFSKVFSIGVEYDLGLTGLLKDDVVYPEELGSTKDITINSIMLYLGFKL